MADKFYLEDVRRLLSDAFDARELEILAFDLLPKLAPNLASLDHEQRTQRITDYAYRHGRIDEVLSYVREKVPYQYKRYLVRYGDRALANKEFDKAIKAFREVGDEEKVKQVEAEKRRVVLEELERTAIELEKEEAWAAAERIYRQLVALEPDNKRWIEAVDRAEKEQLLNELYAEALNHIQQENWEQAEEALVRIINIRATYRDAAQLLAEVARKSTLRHREVGSGSDVSSEEPPVVLPPTDEQKQPLLPSEESSLSTNGVKRTSVPAGVFALLLIPVLALVWRFYPQGPITPASSPTATSFAGVSDAGATEATSTPPASSATSAPDAIPPQTAAEAVELLRTIGVITVGVRVDAPPFGMMINGERQGFDIDLAHEFAARWLGDFSAVILEPVAADQRLPFLQKREGDLLAAAFSYSPERCKVVDCSQIYALDGARLLVPMGSTVANICDLDGEFVAVLDGTSGRRNINDATRWCNYSTPPQTRVYDTRDAAIEAVKTGVVAAYTTDGRILEQFADDGLKVVGDEFSPEPYHLAVPRDHKGLLELINLTLQEMKADGTYDALHAKWFGCESAPFPIVIEPGPRPDFVKRVGTSVTGSCNRDLMAEDTHEVATGENLGGIATNHYGDFDLYVCIQEANDIDDVRNIAIGTVLTLPPLAECQ